MSRKMEYIEFKKYMQSAVSNYYGNEAEVELHRVVKNNSLQLDSLIIRKEGSNISPNFYLQFYYKEYITGRRLDEIVQEIIENYEKMYEENKEVEIDLSLDFCKERIVYRLVSYAKNKELLQEIPYIPFLDMVIVFYCLIKQDENGIGSIRVSNVLMERWGMNTKQLYQIAQENTSCLFPKRMNTIYEMIQNMGTELFGMDDFYEQFTLGELQKESEAIPYTVTNSNGINGAAAILYENSLQEIGEFLQGDFYILPSSVHEVLVISANTELSENELKKMVLDVNKKCVSLDEILSDNIYRYSVEEKRLEICD